MQLRTVPFEIDVPAIAKGLLDLFTDDERVVLRFGMLPAEKMRCVEQSLRDRFLRDSTVVTKDTGDDFLALTNIPGRRMIDFKMSKLVSEAMHEISLELYRIGDLVV